MAGVVGGLPQLVSVAAVRSTSPLLPPPLPSGTGAPPPPVWVAEAARQSFLASFRTEFGLGPLMGSVKPNTCASMFEL
jgi:hypothetical protein